MTSIKQVEKRLEERELLSSFLEIKGLFQN